MPILPQAAWSVVLAAILAPTIANRLHAQEASQFLENGVTAHRGCSAECPENTLRAFQAAIDLGADWLECDVYKTRDGRLVILHDPTTKRVGDRELRPGEVTYEELKKVDVAHGFRQRNKLSLAQCPVERIPLLEEVLELVKQQHKTRLSIQPKDDSTAEIVAMVERHEAVRWVGFNDGSLKKMSLVKQLNPAIPVFWDRDKKFDLDRDLPIARQHGFETIVPHYQVVTAEVVAKIHRAGFKVGAWTVNEEAEMRRLLGLGVDRLYTDDPRRLLSIK